MYPNNAQTYQNPPPPPLPSTVPQQTPNGGIPGQWSTGLCDFFDDPSNCCITCFCPCITFGRIAEFVDKGTTSCAIAGALFYLLASVGCVCLYTCSYRSRLRGLYSLEEAPCQDCLVHWFCLGCALCQEYRELKNRGADPSIGWQANVARWNSGSTMPPNAAQGMYR